MKKLNEFTAANRDAWDASAAAFEGKPEWQELVQQLERGGFSHFDQTMTETLMRLGVEGCRTVQIGCNNGRELFSLPSFGAIPVLGIDVSEAFLWDVYTQALAVQERLTVPPVGAPIGRRAFEGTLERYNDHSIRALICSPCARVCLETGGPRSQIESKTGGWLLSLPCGSLTKNQSKDSFERRFQQAGTPLAARGRGECSPDFTEWQLFWHTDATYVLFHALRSCISARNPPRL